MIIKSVYIALITSILCGVIYVIPNLFFINSSSYKGILVMPTDAESLYLTKIAGAYKWCIYSCNPYIKEYNYKYPHFDASLSSFILAIPGIIFEISAVHMKLFYEFILTFALSLISYFLVYRLTKNIYISVLGSLYLVLGFNLLNVVDLMSIPDIVNIFKFKTDYTQFLIFSRPINPQFSSVYFLLYLHVLLTAVRAKNLKWSLILSIAYGFSFYIYFFTYAFATVVQSVLVFTYLIKKEWRYFLIFLISTLLGLLIAIPIFSQIIRVMTHEYHKTIPTEYLVYSHIPHISIIGVILFLLFIIISIFYYRKFGNLDDDYLFIGIILVSCFIARNEHIVSGMIMQYDHFEIYIFTPIFILFICFILSKFISNQKLFDYRFILIFLMILPIYNASLIQYSSYKHWLPYSKYVQRHISVLKWLKEETSNSIISAPQSLSPFIPLYTNNYVLWTLYAGQWISIPSRIEDINNSRTSKKTLLEVGKKYNVDYFIEEKRDDLLKNSSLKKLYEDDFYVVYK